MKFLFSNILLFLFAVFSLNTKAQKVLESEIIYGGITGGGFSTNSGSGTIISNVSIPPNSNIKKAYLLATRDGVAPNIDVVLNGITYEFSNQTVVSDKFISTINTWTWENSTIHAIDITDDLDSSITAYALTIPPQFNQIINGFYSSFYIYIVYENFDLSKIAYNIFINEKDVGVISSYNLNDFPPINNNVPVCLGVWSTFFCDTIEDGSYIEVSGNELGLLGGTESNTLHSCTGVYCNFAHYNDSIFGLEDDIPDSLMKATDALADIKSYISYNVTNVDIIFTLQTPGIQGGKLTNPIAALMLSYSTPCDTFSVDIPDQIQVCKGDSVQIQLSGGNEWEWEPAVGLSCTNCPNPYFTDTVSRWYTVRVWNNDSCSKVLPVRVAVVPKPLNPIVQTSPTKCSDSSGVATVQLIASSYLYAIDNGTFQSNAVFSQLSAGNHNISVVDTNGCVAETNFSISETFPTAKFTASPLEGDVPLDVNFTNQSTGATDFIWYIANDTLYSVNPNYTFEEEGNFNVTLVAYDTYLHCSDTASVQIFATFPFTVIAPSLFVKQDAPYQIYTSNLATLQYELYNSIGQQLYHHTLQPTQGLNDVWYPYNISRGIYLYRITAKDDEGNEKVFSGKVVVM